MNRYRFWLRERLADSQEWINGRDRLRFELVLLACLVIGLTAIIFSVYLPALYGFVQGSPAPRSVVAERTITVLDSQATENLKAQVGQLVEPVYFPDAEALTRATTEMEVFLQGVGSLRKELAETSDLDQALAKLQRVAPRTTSVATLEYLLTAGSYAYEQMQRQALVALKALYANRITDGSLEAAREKLRSITDALALSAATSDALYEMVSAYVRPNQLVDQEQTLARREAAMAEIAPVMVTILKGEQVVQKGELVTAYDALALEAMGLAQTRSGWKVWLGVFLIVALEVAVFSRLLHRFNKTAGFGNNMLLALVVLMLGATAVGRVLVLPPLSAYLIPVAALGMVVSIILNARSALLLVVLTSLNIGLLTDFDMRYSLVAVIVGALSLYLVSRVAQRAALLGAGFATMLLAAFTVFSIEVFKEASSGEALRAGAWGLANGLLAGVLTILLLLVLDTVFNLTTPLRLLELANPAQPLLKKLLQVAPGTYNHSILMGNLAEAAAETIGADPLLARVGAYYHDIGKTVRPDYFSENQIYVSNPHDRLSPNLSKLAITAHVRDGEHLARQYGLPAPVVDIIKQHHGTSVLVYQYHKALEASKDQVDEESYRYEEQKPQSKEAAIVMLADRVEAQVKAMQNPTRRKIQGAIQEIIKQKVQDGQLDESPLTQSDLHKIRDSFDTSLRGLVGHRIRYPELNGQNGHRSRGPSTGHHGTPAPADTAEGPVRSATPPSAAALRARSAPPTEPADPAAPAGDAKPGDGSAGEP
ncbi:MAG: HDIG domain-containing metalloprotein [bacterium]